MTTTVFFIRHVPHALQGKVQVGRTEDVPLAPGSAELAAGVGQRLSREPLAAVYASPVLRARKTAEAIAERFDFEVRTREGLNEIDTGEWTGRGFEELEAEPAYRDWCGARSLARMPGGETMLEVQARMVAALEAIRRDHPDEHVAVVSHGDPIKSVLLYLLGLPLDAYDRIEIDPGSVTTAVVGDWGAKIIRLNEIA